MSLLCGCVWAPPTWGAPAKNEETSMKYAFIAAAMVAVNMVSVTTAMADEEQVCIGGPQDQ